MNSRFRKIKKEWERTLMTVVLLCVLLSLGVLAFFMMNEEQGSTDRKNAFRAPREYFDSSSKLYLESPALDGKSRNAMAYSIKLKMPPAKKAPAKPQVQPEKKKPVAQVKPKPKAPPKTQAKAPVKKQAPPIKLTVKYRGCMQFDDGQPVAFCTSTSSKDKKSRPASLKKGDKVHGMLVIDSFDENTLTLSYKGKSVGISKGKEHVFTVN